MDEIDFIQPKTIVGKLISVDVLDKIRAEIASISPKTYPFYDHMDDYIKTKDVLKIIDKYRKEEK